MARIFRKKTGKFEEKGETISEFAQRKRAEKLGISVKKLREKKQSIQRRALQQDIKRQHTFKVRTRSGDTVFRTVVPGRGIVAEGKNPVKISAPVIAGKQRIQAFSVSKIMGFKQLHNGALRDVIAEKKSVILKRKQDDLQKKLSDRMKRPVSVNLGTASGSVLAGALGVKKKTVGEIEGKKGIIPLSKKEIERRKKEVVSIPFEFKVIETSIKSSKNKVEADQRKLINQLRRSTKSSDKARLYLALAGTGIVLGLADLGELIALGVGKAMKINKDSIRNTPKVLKNINKEVKTNLVSAVALVSSAKISDIPVVTRKVLSKAKNKLTGEISSWRRDPVGYQARVIVNAGADVSLVALEVISDGILRGVPSLRIFKKGKLKGISNFVGKLKDNVNISKKLSFNAKKRINLKIKSLKKKIGILDKEKFRIGKLSKGKKNRKKLRSKIDDLIEALIDDDDDRRKKRDDDDKKKEEEKKKKEEEDEKKREKKRKDKRERDERKRREKRNRDERKRREKRERDERRSRKSRERFESESNKLKSKVKLERIKKSLKKGERVAYNILIIKNDKLGRLKVWLPLNRAKKRVIELVNAGKIDKGEIYPVGKTRKEDISILSLKRIVKKKGRRVVKKRSKAVKRVRGKKSTKTKKKGRRVVKKRSKAVKRVRKRRNHKK